MVNKVRRGACIIYLLIGAVLLGFFFLSKFPILIQFFLKNLSTILWGAGWSSIGVGLGLWSDPKDNPKDDKAADPIHYITYFLFVWFMGTLAAISASAVGTGIQSYAASAFVAVAVGFCGDELASRLGPDSKH